MNKKPYRVIVGPYRAAMRYAKRRNWADDDIVIICRGHQLAGLDPAHMIGIITVGTQKFSSRVLFELRQEVRRITALWPVPVVAAA